ncbi:ParA family protein [Leptolyngbya sp. AN03gr2]|uniref:ParA family protein n=1 Tax=unclassified Leptolyngbya TaxID=2650499 RepID=UPI003D32204D
MQVRLTIESNTGGSGKTTLASHLSYALAKKKHRVVIIELDPNGSMALFTGLPKLRPDEVEDSIACIFERQFKGDYPLVPVWEDYTNLVQVIRGGSPLHTAIRGLHLHERPYEVLKDRLEDYPIDADVIIVDTPASVEPMGLIALAAATHFIAAIKPEFKDSWSSSDMLNWFYEKVDSLRLRPRPEILGFVPSRVDLQKAVHRNLLGLKPDGTKNDKIDPVDTIPYQLEQLEIPCFPHIKESGFFLSASGTGLPVHLYRPDDKITKSFDPIVKEIVKHLKNK